MLYYTYTLNSQGRWRDDWGTPITMSVELLLDISVSYWETMQSWHMTQGQVSKADLVALQSGWTQRWKAGRGSCDDVPINKPRPKHTDTHEYTHTHTGMINWNNVANYKKDGCRGYEYAYGPGKSNLQHWGKMWLDWLCSCCSFCLSFPVCHLCLRVFYGMWGSWICFLWWSGTTGNQRLWPTALKTLAPSVTMQSRQTHIHHRPPIHIYTHTHTHTKSKMYTNKSTVEINKADSYQRHLSALELFWLFYTEVHPDVVFWYATHRFDLLYDPTKSVG